LLKAEARDEFMILLFFPFVQIGFHWKLVKRLFAKNKRWLFVQKNERKRIMHNPRTKQLVHLENSSFRMIFLKNGQALRRGMFAHFDQRKSLFLLTQRCFWNTERISYLNYSCNLSLFRSNSYCWKCTLLFSSYFCIIKLFIQSAN
jgi:hypothetical protein